MDWRVSFWVVASALANAENGVFKPLHSFWHESAASAFSSYFEVSWVSLTAVWLIKVPKYMLEA